MLFYKITYQTKHVKNGPVTNHVAWVGSGKEASAKRKLIRQMFRYIPNSVQTLKVDVPTDKISLLKFLNKGVFLEIV